jgi:hypothetical protein
MEVRPFEVRVSEEVLDDLRERLVRTRWPDEVAGAGWDYGTNLAYLRELVGYWGRTFDWREQEQKLNRFAHFRAEVDGFGVHFIHKRGEGDDPMPLVLTHGWPSTFFEFSKIVPLLTDPESHGGTRPTPSPWSVHPCPATASPSAPRSSASPGASPGSG